MIDRSVGGDEMGRGIAALVLAAACLAWACKDEGASDFFGNDPPPGDGGQTGDGTGDGGGTEDDSGDDGATGSDDGATGDDGGATDDGGSSGDTNTLPDVNECGDGILGNQEACDDLKSLTESRD